MKKDSQESIKKQISHYTAKHRELSGLLEMEERKRVPNAIEVRRLKKLKLMTKDKTSALETRLAQKSALPQHTADVIQLPLAQPEPDLIPARRTATG
jgi:hypothetical protein